MISSCLTDGRVEQGLAVALDMLQLGITITDVNGVILYVNSAEARMHGYTPDELVGKNARLFSPSSIWKWMNADELQKIRRWKRESLNVRNDGSLFPVQLTSDAILDPDGHVAAIITISEDIRERKAAEEVLRSRQYIEANHDALHDPLTRLPNRLLFLERLRLELSRTSADRPPRFAVLFIDLDHFKIINDSYGHLIGDQLLESVSVKLQSCLRPDDLVARVGGDEFTVLLSDLQGQGDVSLICDRIQEAFRSAFVIEGHRLSVTVSVGIGLAKNSYHRAEDLLRDADVAMYCAKAQGRARCVVFKENISEKR